jgi:beta-lysine 5,6-aminomutase alpha subunit
LSDRDLALQNVRYVLGAAGGLAEDFAPPRDGFIQTRARHVLGEAVELLERIVADGLLPAIGDGTFGLMKRPANGGKGLDGVVARATGEHGYDNPALTLLAGGPR